MKKIATRTTTAAIIAQINVATIFDLVELSLYILPYYFNYG